MDESEAFLAKAEENLADAESAFTAGRYNSCANRAYYACYQAAIAALHREDIRPSGKGGQWGHDFVQSQFVGRLINRRKRYPAAFRDTLIENQETRFMADYDPVSVSEIRAARSLRRTRALVATIRDNLGEKS